MIHCIYFFSLFFIAKGEVYLFIKVKAGFLLKIIRFTEDSNRFANRSLITDAIFAIFSFPGCFCQKKT